MRGTSGADVGGDPTQPEGFRCLRHRGTPRLRAGVLTSGNAGGAAFAAGGSVGANGAMAAPDQELLDMHPLSLPPPSPPPSPFGFGKKESDEERDARRARADEVMQAEENRAKVCCSGPPR